MSASLLMAVYSFVQAFMVDYFLKKMPSKTLQHSEALRKLNYDINYFVTIFELKLMAITL